MWPNVGRRGGYAAAPAVSTSGNPSPACSVELGGRNTMAHIALRNRYEPWF